MSNKITPATAPVGVEERASALLDGLPYHDELSRAELQKAIVQLGRELVEDCAKAADEFLTSGDRLAAQLIGGKIRALAGPSLLSPEKQVQLNRALDKLDDLESPLSSRAAGLLAAVVGEGGEAEC